MVLGIVAELDLHCVQLDVESALLSAKVLALINMPLGCERNTKT